MIGFINISVTISLNYNQYSAIADLHTFQFTIAHALEFSAFTSRLLATYLNTGTSTSNHCEVFLPFLVQSPWNLELN
jgi:tryptophanyl-tRNA synthetase